MNTKYQYNLHDSWSVALSQGHSAFLLLSNAHKIETRYEQSQKKLQSLPSIHPDYHSTLAESLTLTKEMLQTSSASIASFQSMMEAIINNAIASESLLLPINTKITNKKGKWATTSFEQKWEMSLTELEQPLTHFQSYHKSIYKRFRIPLIHPCNAKLADIDALEYAVMRDGYRDGWMAYEQLYKGLGKGHTPDSWQTMCQTHAIR